MLISGHIDYVKAFHIDLVCAAVYICVMSFLGVYIYVCVFGALFAFSLHLVCCLIFHSVVVVFFFRCYFNLLVGSYEVVFPF